MTTTVKTSTLLNHIKKMNVGTEQNLPFGQGSAKMVNYYKIKIIAYYTDKIGISEKSRIYNEFAIYYNHTL